MNEHKVVRRTAITFLLGGLLALGVAACGSSTPKAASSAGGGNKTAFCNADIAIDKAGSSVTTMAGFLTVLESNQSDLAILKNDGPGSIRSQAQGLVSVVEKAIADHNPNDLNTNAADNDGAAVDTFCGVDGSGNPLPSYFAAGKGTAFCSVSDQINQGTSTATGPPQILSFLTAHQSLVNDYATDLASLPAKQKAEAEELVTIARTAITSKNAAPLGSTTVQNDSGDIQDYCGHNS